MSGNGACGIVITYHPKDSVFEHLSILRSQADGLVVVDNGSTPDVLERLRSESYAIGFHLIESGENRGVAAALNTGIKWAIENKSKWVALFDQDSTIPEGYIDALLAGVSSQSDPERIAIVAPQYRNPSTGQLYKSGFKAEDG